MIININDRLFKDFKLWAEANGMNEDQMTKYIEKAFRDKFTLDKYGDLNEKLRKPEPAEEAPKPKRTRKPKAEPKPEGVTEGASEGVKPAEPTSEQISEHINEPISERINEPAEEEKPKKRTKIIVSK